MPLRDKSKTAGCHVPQKFRVPVAGLLPCAGLWGVTTPRAAGQCREMASSGSRYGLRLKKRSPESFKRMRAILGYYDQPTSLKSDEPAVESVTLSLLQTLKYLPLDVELKRRLLIYKTLSLNRELEGLHASTRAFLGQLHAQESKGPAIPAFMMGKQAGAKKPGTQ
ncbi:hypothetical protein DUNSADRAFT_8085 [Dunaliella salina]|uniref:Encoded protein n=1 Tax=Dunaliella salina TaxID=3046 RepID=A0ABQ7GK89_DUNSA|nr:hypothetical protein DUNSADRAFT_8085 [Dunaliella salina]|eukprot:KAF5834985.1 hypothetical protein DUNSADRAFT_8085 [Dunaliella salina]